MDAFLHHFEQGSLLRAMIFQTKTTPGEHFDNVIERCRGQVDAIAPGWNRAWWPAEHIELRCRVRNLACQSSRFPDGTCVARFDGLIALVIKAPIAVKGKTGEPVALSQRIGKAGIDAAGRVNADQIST